MKFREIEKIILADGWKCVDTAGSHRQYKHPKKSGKVTIPRHKGDLNVKTAASILKQAGIKR
ncbi:MAG: type II toxin-antitoxin system HicA family toxin [Oscillospiraceae bacterium]|nr:type II toxin-antitoxin system HicA family toxin [Oscillospiraceae bacterium]